MRSLVRVGSNGTGCRFAASSAAKYTNSQVKDGVLLAVAKTIHAEEIALP